MTDPIQDALHTYRCCELEMFQELAEIDRIKAKLSEAQTRYNKALLARLACADKLGTLGFTAWEEIGL